MAKKYFKILAPFSNQKDIKPLRQAGADELYCGYVTHKLTKKWPLAFNLLNRRGEGGSFDNYQIFKQATEEARALGLPVYVTVNGLYTPEQYPLLMDLIKDIESLNGIKGIIIADLGFLLTLKKHKFSKEIHMGTGGTCFNSSTANFYHRLGVERIILPRQLTAREIADLVSQSEPKIDFEIFIVNEGCGGFIDGFCTFFHVLEKHKFDSRLVKNDFWLCPSYNTEQQSEGCLFYFDEVAKGNLKIFNLGASEKEIKRLRFKEREHNMWGCRICDLFELYRYPIRSLKIVGRAMELKNMISSVRLIVKSLSFLKEEDMTKQEYTKRCRDIFSKLLLNNQRRCSEYDCYFSDLWLKKRRP